MPRSRSPNRERAYEIYKEHNGNIKNRRIAEILQISEKTVGGWKCKDSWDEKLNGVLQTKERSTPKEKGGQPGNKNAAGHGGTGPPGNKNAIKTGEFETLFFDALDQEEQKLIQMVQPDKEKLLLQEIQLLTVRERRMLKRIEDIKNSVAYLDDEKIADGFTVTKMKSGIEKGYPTDLKEYEGKLGQIQAIEDALTRVQARRQRAIETLHKFGYDDAHLELETMKFELEMIKQGGQDDENEDDGFVNAMNAVVSDVWGDQDE